MATTQALFLILAAMALTTSASTTTPRSRLYLEERKELYDSIKACGEDAECCLRVVMSDGLTEQQKEMLDDDRLIQDALFEVTGRIRSRSPSHSHEETTMDGARSNRWSNYFLQMFRSKFGWRGWRGRSSGGDRRARGIVTNPGDTRTTLNGVQTSLYPFSTGVCLKLASDSKCHCSGVLVSRSHLLTAAHCVRANNQDIDIEAAYMAPFNQQYVDLGISASYTINKTYTPSTWRNSENPTHDYALVLLNPDDNGDYAGDDYGWMAFGHDPNYATDWVLNSFGFPNDLATQESDPWYAYSYDIADQKTNKQIYHLVDTYTGMSGAPLYHYYPSTGQRVIFAIHSSWSNLPGESIDDTSYNLAPRINNYRFGQICGWILETPNMGTCT
eukprot:m.39700 g.39700  ORF g.39700 m.39700 type:complete len:387 (-) comp9582_c0_seq1:228-1388(-)